MRFTLIMIFVMLIGCGDSQPNAELQLSDSSQAPINQAQTMKIFWNDCGRGIKSGDAKPVTLAEAEFVLSNEVRGVEGNFIGLVDEKGRTIQFYFDEGIPDDVGDAEHLEIVQLDFPWPEGNGSYGRKVTIGEMHGLIEKAFKVGADYRQFDAVTFTSW